MKKLRIEDLVVDSFVTSLNTGRRGTIEAHQSGIATCGLDCTNTCSDNSTQNPGHSRNGITCNISCELGQTDCGTCAPYDTCDPETGCWGNSQDMRPC